jgi:hypothetical protein
MMPASLTDKCSARPDRPAARGHLRQHANPDTLLSIAAEDMQADAKWQTIIWQTKT